MPDTTPGPHPSASMSEEIGQPPERVTREALAKYRADHAEKSPVAAPAETPQEAPHEATSPEESATEKARR